MRTHVWRSIAVIVILILTVAVFADYYTTHPVIAQELRHTHIQILTLILILYLGTIGALMLVALSTLRLCKVRLPLHDNLLLNAYTTVINFFGPLQSGPAFRAVYLKKKYQLNLKRYAVATLLYYFFFAIISGTFLLSGLLKWWLVPLFVLGACGLLIFSRSKFFARKFDEIDLHAWYYLAAATFLQLSLVAAIYYSELHSLDNHISVSQAIIYTGAANFALFVSITPGAIGFRESFLVFTRHLHHISNSLIVAANILDRAMYFVLLLILIVFLLLTHAKKQLASQTPQD
jgi:uncharacterized membrane protein YbhN (UPF0104 family)